MDELAIQTIDEEPAVEIERLWLEQRQRAAEFLAQHKSHLDEIDLRLAAQLDLISSQLSEASNVSDEQLVEFSRRKAELDERQLKIEQDHEKSALELQQWSDQLRQKQQELERRSEELQASVEKTKQDERALESARQEHDAALAQFARSQAELDEKQRRLADELAAIEKRRQESASHDQQIAEELKRQQAQQIEELDRKRAELEAAQRTLADGSNREQALRQELERAKAETEQAQAALTAERQKLAAERSELDELRRSGEAERLQFQHDLTELKKQQAALDAAAQGSAAIGEELARLRKDCERLSAECAQHQATAKDHAAQTVKLEHALQENQRIERELHEANALARGAEKQLSDLQTAYEALKQESADRQSAAADPVELAKVAGERDSLADQVAAANERIGQLEEALALAQSQAATTGAQAGDDDQQLQDLQRRFELAVEDVRSLKRRNAELEDQLAGVKAGRIDHAQSGAQDWESLKKRMMAELEADTDDTPERQQERISIENTIRTTSDLVSEKDREIEELKQLLNQQSDNLGSLAVGATAIEQMFDQDELIRQERERLQQAQLEWREKLKQAEIDVSLERARIARERVELDEKLRTLETERAQHDQAASGQPNPKNNKPARGRWLERLGLKEGEK